MADLFTLAGKTYRSRLLTGTGRFADMPQMAEATKAAGSEIVTVAVRRKELSAKESIQDYLEPLGVTLLPNTAGCYTAEEAVRTLRLARELGGYTLVKLEVIGDANTLLPNEAETLRAAKMLVVDGFEVMAYTTDNIALAGELEAAGCVAVMPAGSPIGSGQGIARPENIKAIVAQAGVPVLVDAGIGSPADAVLAMELGCDGVLVNSAIAHARSPVAMAAAMKQAVEAGRAAYLAGCMEKQEQAQASSPKLGLIS